jgi:hypothetical protein
MVKTTTKEALFEWICQFSKMHSKLISLFWKFLAILNCKNEEALATFNMIYWQYCKKEIEKRGNREAERWIETKTDRQRK